MTFIPDKDEVADSNSAGPTSKTPDNSAGNEQNPHPGELFPNVAKACISSQTHTVRGVVSGVGVFTYFLQGERGGPIKIGKAVDVAKRVKEIQTGYPYPLKILAVIDGNVEKTLHAKFSEHRTSGEWFEPAPALLKYIAKVIGEQVAVMGTGLVHEDALRPPGQIMPLLVRHLMAKYGAERWHDLDIDEEDEDLRTAELYERIEVAHFSLFGVDITHAGHDGSTDSDEEDADEPPIEDCECEECMLNEAAEWLADVPLYGFMECKGRGSILLLIRWPAVRHIQEELAKSLEHAAFCLDTLCLNIHAALIGPDGSYDLVEMCQLYGGKWLDRPKERWVYPDGDAISAIMGFSSISADPSPPAPAKGGAS